MEILRSPLPGTKPKSRIIPATITEPTTDVSHTHTHTVMYTPSPWSGKTLFNLQPLLCHLGAKASPDIRKT